MEKTQPLVRRTRILAYSTPNSIETDFTLPDFDPNARRRPQAGQQRRGGATPHADITAAILEAGRAAQQQAKQRREALQARVQLPTPPTSQDAPTRPRPLDKRNETLGGNQGAKQPENAVQDVEKVAPKKPQKSRKSEEEAAEKRLEQWAMLDAARPLVGDHRTAQCYRVPLPLGVSGLTERGAVEVRHITREDGTTRARFGNLGVCGSVWACPICAERIAQKRAAEVDDVLQQHRAAGGRLMFVTLTHEHDRNGKLSDQLRKQADALKAMQEAYSYKTLMQENGVLGMIRGLEMTHSNANGWHVHLHFLVLLAGTEEQAQRHAQVLTEMDAEQAARLRELGKTPRQKKARQPVKIPKVTRLPRFGADLIAQWQKAAKSAGLYAHRAAQRAVIASDDDASLSELARYLTKCEWDDEKREYVSTGENNPQPFGGEAAHRAAVEMVEQAGSKASSAGQEIAMLQSKKSSLTPMGMLRAYTFGRVHKADTPERKAADRRARRAGALFAEYVRETKGRAALVWGQGLKRMYAVQEQPDEEAAQQDEQPAAVDVSLCVLRPTDWHVVLDAPRGTRGQLLEIARKGDPTAVFAFVETLRQRRARGRPRGEPKPSQ